MKMRFAALLATVMAFTAVSPGISADDTNVAVAVDGENVDVQVFVNTKPGAEQFTPPGYARDVAAGCLYRSFNPLPDEFASWSGVCDQHGYVTGQGRLTFSYPTGAPSHHLLMREGNFVDGVAHGTGRDKSLDGQDRRGSFVNGVLNGAAEITYSDGGYYKGEVRSGQLTGFGEMHYADGRYYRGNWLNNRRHGYGESTNPRGQQYKGEFLTDRPYGQGLLIQANGECHEGQFGDGRFLNGRTWRCGT